jgi:hypothetical protein
MISALLGRFGRAAWRATRRLALPGEIFARTARCFVHLQCCGVNGSEILMATVTLPYSGRRLTLTGNIGRGKVALTSPFIHLTGSLRLSVPRGYWNLRNMRQRGNWRFPFDLLSPTPSPVMKWTVFQARTGRKLWYSTE